MTVHSTTMNAKVAHSKTAAMSLFSGQTFLFKRQVINSKLWPKTLFNSISMSSARGHGLNRKFQWNSIEKNSIIRILWLMSPQVEIKLNLHRISAGISHFGGNERSKSENICWSKLNVLPGHEEHSVHPVSLGGPIRQPTTDTWVTWRRPSGNWLPFFGSKS